MNIGYLMLRKFFNFRRLNTKAASKHRNRFEIVGALLLTPYIILINTSVDLYVRNREELDNKIAVLLPFVVFSALLFAVGWIFYRMKNKHVSFKLLLIMYCLAGPFFLTYQFISILQVAIPIKVLLFLSPLIVLSAVTYKKVRMKQMMRILSQFLVILVTIQTVSVVSKIANSNAPSNLYSDKEVPLNQENSVMQDSEAPNIYHIVLDQFQTDMFEIILQDDIKGQMGGFTYYPQNRAIYERTNFSLASIFSGRQYDLSNYQEDFWNNSFNSKESILYWLKSSGYINSILAPDVYGFDMKLFDNVQKQNLNVIRNASNAANYEELFINLWIYANTPEKLSELIIDDESLNQIKGQDALPESRPVAAREWYEYATLNQTKGEKNTGNYKLFHFLLPHNPFVLDENCLYDENRVDSVDFAANQAKCTISLTLDFMDKLKENGEYDSSLIIIHGDHGAGVKKVDNELRGVQYRNEAKDNEEWAYARMRSLLLVKLPGMSKLDNFVVSDRLTTLLDIAPTILNIANIDSELNLEGQSLLSDDGSLSGKPGPYFFLSQRNKEGNTLGLSRYIVRGNDLTFDRIFPLKTR